MLSLNELTAISPIDGRYRSRVQDLADIASEYGLIRYRVQVECQYLLALSQENVGLKLTATEKKYLKAWQEVSVEEAGVIQAIERTGYKDIPATNHDVKAVEYWLREKFAGTTLADKTQWIHFGLTSEDVNNIAYALMLRDCSSVWLDSLDILKKQIETLANRYAISPMLARTHGQSASPTTFGKEMRVFVERLTVQLQQLARTTILAKLNGATGNYNALVVAYPKVNWPVFSTQFIAGLNTSGKGVQVACNLTTTQIEPHDSWAQLFHTMVRINTILLDFSQDMWRYISDGWVKQKTTAGEVGSSTMPHKVNPIDFENGEGNLGVANSLLTFLAAKLPISRLQRDLSDSTVERTMGVAFAHSLVGCLSITKGLGKIVPDVEYMAQVVTAHPEVLAEAIQTILRREGVSEAYEKLKEITRGREVTMEDLRLFISELPVSAGVKRELLALQPKMYVGLAPTLASTLKKRGRG